MHFVIAVLCQIVSEVGAKSPSSMNLFVDTMSIFNLNSYGELMKLDLRLFFEEYETCSRSPMHRSDGSSSEGDS
ncbi:hypothetical protein M758_UG300300 [Ceratodon purpureus]|nr:hypothetical protein M758_UG300300 [Ceratodon purpureus]